MDRQINIQNYKIVNVELLCIPKDKTYDEKCVLHKICQHGSAHIVLLVSC